MASNRHILLVDDYELNRILAKKHLESEGYIVDVAEDGSQAVEAFERRRFDLILMDIEMPVLNGWKSTARIRALESAAASGSSGRVPIIAMSGHAMKEDADRYRRAGMDDCLAKPIERAGVLKMVRKWLDQPAVAGAEAQASDRICDADQRPDEHPAPVDIRKVTEEFMGDADTVRRLLREFVSRGRGQVAAIARALNNDDFEQVRFEAHALRGGAANLTAARLADCCTEMEAAAETASPGESGRLFRLLAALEKQFMRLATYVDNTGDSAESAGQP